ncbi:hypothetical protein [Bacillus phage vB_BanS-Thrax1]|nr:hypothetical protein [Bacillus phage vB_BanS-Thrax1]
MAERKYPRRFSFQVDGGDVIYTADASLDDSKEQNKIYLVMWQDSDGFLKGVTYLNERVEKNLDNGDWKIVKVLNAY